MGKKPQYSAYDIKELVSTLERKLFRGDFTCLFAYLGKISDLADDIAKEIKEEEKRQSGRKWVKERRSDH